MVLIKRETSVNLNLGEGNNLGIFNYNASAKENLDKSEALRMVAFQIFRDVQKGKNRETKMKTAIRKHSQVLYLTQKSLKEEDRAEFLAKDYRKALTKFIDDLEGMKLPELIQIASDKQYLDEDDDNVEQLSKLNLTIGQLGSEGQVRRELQLPLGQMTDEPDDLLGTSLARAMMGNKNLAPPRDYKEIIEHIDIRTEGDATLLVFRAKDYLHRLLDSNGYMASESTSDNPVVRKGLEYPMVNNKGVKDKKPVVEDDEETEEQVRTREEADIGRELEADMSIEDDSEGVEVTGEDDNLEDLSDEEFADALTEQTKKVKKLLKAKMGDKLDPDKLDPTGPSESILSFITYKDGTFTLVKPDGTEIKSKSVSDIANDGEDVTITKTMLEKILKKPVPSKEEMNPIQRLVFDSLQPSEGEITVKNYSMKLKIAGDTPAIDIYDSVLQLTETEDPDEFTEDQGKEIKASIRSNLRDFLKELVEFHKLLKTEELKRMFYAADSRQDFIDNMIEFRNIPYVSQDDEDDEEEQPEESLPEEDYRAIMARVGMKTRAGKTTTGQPSPYFQSGAASDSPFGKEGAEKIMNTTLDIGDKEQRVALIIPRMRGVTPTVQNFSDAIYDANFQRKPKDGKIDFTRESAILIPNKDVRFGPYGLAPPNPDLLETTTSKYNKFKRPKQGQELSKPSGLSISSTEDGVPSGQYEYSDTELREMRGSEPTNPRTMVKLISVTEDIKQLAGKPLFVSFRTYKRQRKTTERDRTPKKTRYTENLLGVLQKVKILFDKLRTNTKR